MPRLRSAPSRLRAAPSRFPTQPKRTDPHYGTAAHKAWALEGKELAGWKCQDCGKATSRLHADHIVERQDGGADLDPNNRRIRCDSCHGIKTAQERAGRLAT